MLQNTSFYTKNSRLHATPPAQTAVPPPSAAVEGGDGVERLEPRVEKREGYWVLKEKFRKGINPQEKVKIESEPMKFFVENGIEDLAKIPIEDLDKLKATKDDVDVRLKWLGLFHRRKHHCKFLKPSNFDLIIKRTHASALSLTRFRLLTSCCLCLVNSALV